MTSILNKVALQKKKSHISVDKQYVHFKLKGEAICSEAIQYFNKK